MANIDVIRSMGAALFGGALILTGCGGGSAAGGPTAGVEVLAGPVASTDVAQGEHEFEEHCSGCHTAAVGGDAYGPAVVNIAWDPARMRSQIRRGAGRMPGIGPSEMSDTHLEALLAYLQTLGGVSPNP